MGTRGFQNVAGLVADLRDAAQVAFIGRQQVFQARQTGVHQRMSFPECPSSAVLDRVARR